MAIKKPKSCEQKWVLMTPSEGGRICSQCNKVIIDFSKMRWRDIERIQQQNNNNLCGMYSPKQLVFWGKEVPEINCSKIVTSTALLVTLTASTSSFSQSTISIDTTKRTIINGTVTSTPNNGRYDPIVSTLVILKGTSHAVQTNSEGQYQLDVSGYIDTIQNPALIFTMIGYKTLELPLNIKPNTELKYDVQLNEDDPQLSIFYVRAPTRSERIRWKLKKWFRRKPT